MRRRVRVVGRASTLPGRSLLAGRGSAGSHTHRGKATRRDLARWTI